MADVVIALVSFYIDCSRTPVSGVSLPPEIVLASNSWLSVIPSPLHVVDTLLGTLPSF